MENGSSPSVAANPADRPLSIASSQLSVYEVLDVVGVL